MRTRIAALTLLLLQPVAHAFAEPVATAEPTASPSPIDEADLTGEQIYERALDNRFYTYVQEIEMESGDRTQMIQRTELELKYLSFRGVDERIRSKSIAKYSRPADVRHLGYLVIKKADDSEDQFVYRPSSRRVRRINLRGEAVFGTDFSMEDVVPREIEDATYRRLPDGEIGETDGVDGIPVFVVEVTPLPEKQSEYSRFIAHIEKTHYVSIRNDYWDDSGVPIKQLNADTDSIAMFSGVERNGDLKEIWVPVRSKMTQLRTGSYTHLHVAELALDVTLRDRDFTERKLTSSR